MLKNLLKLTAYSLTVFFILPVISIFLNNQDKKSNLFSIKPELAHADIPNNGGGDGGDGGGGGDDGGFPARDGGDGGDCDGDDGGGDDDC